MRPVNGTAAMVASQKGCVDDVTLEQERDSIIDRIKQIEGVLRLRVAGEPKTNEWKSLGVEKWELQQRLGEIKKALKIHGFGDENRVDHLDYVISAMKLHLTDMQYRRVMDKAFSMYNKDNELIEDTK